MNYEHKLASLGVKLLLSSRRIGKTKAVSAVGLERVKRAQESLDSSLIHVTYDGLRVVV